MLREDVYFRKTSIKFYGTKTLFEWYTEEMLFYTYKETRNDPFVRAIEHEIEKRFREYDNPPPNRRHRRNWHVEWL